MLAILINYVDAYVTVKSPKRAFPWFLFLISFLTLQESAMIVVSTTTDESPKFPLILGFETGETEIFSIDQDSSTGGVFIAGTTTAKEYLIPGAKKSVFTAFFDGTKFVWTKIINSIYVDTVEFMSAMGASSVNLVLYVTKSSSPYIPLILTIRKSDG